MFVFSMIYSLTPSVLLMAVELFSNVSVCIIECEIDVIVFVLENFWGVINSLSVCNSGEKNVKVDNFREK